MHSRLQFWPYLLPPNLKKYIYVCMYAKVYIQLDNWIESDVCKPIRSPKWIWRFSHSHLSIIMSMSSTVVGLTKVRVQFSPQVRLDGVIGMISSLTFKRGCLVLNREELTMKGDRTRENPILSHHMIPSTVVGWKCGGQMDWLQFLGASLA